MKTWKHMSEDNRKTICSCISHNKKLIEISKIINYDPRAIAKEVKRNRKPVDYADQTESKCPKLNRWPYVCTNCKNRYKDCPFVKFVYDSKVAQRKADANLINSRKGIDLDSEEFNKLDAIIKKGTDENKSIYQIKIENKDSINKSITTLYRYVNNGYLKTKESIYLVLSNIKKESIIKSMNTLTIKLTEVIILTLTICHTFTKIQTAMYGN